MLSPDFWRGRRVFLSGHTGFKGSWMTLILSRLGARVHGYALAPSTSPSMFGALDLQTCVEANTIADIRDAAALRAAMEAARPDIAIHMAAQPLVSASYLDPVETFATNVMGTVHFLEACRAAKPPVIVVVSSDKCYRNTDDGVPFLASSPLGGKDPYSASKAATELVAESWRTSFIEPEGVSRLASARAGNVIGGGDWSDNRLLPDAARAFSRGEPLLIRNPASTRPWQHVLEPVAGYLLLAEALAAGPRAARGWNFGPNPPASVTVEAIADLASAAWPGSPGWTAPKAPEGGFGEAKALLLDCADTVEALGWNPVLPVAGAVAWTMQWYHAFYKRGVRAARECTDEQISRYFDLAAAAPASPAQAFR